MRYIVDDLINLFFKYTLIANVLYNKPAKHMQISINTLVLGTHGRGTGRYKQRTNVIIGDCTLQIKTLLANERT